MSLVDSAIARLLPAVPRQVVRRISERYIAGEELDDALRVVRNLNDQGKLATIDVLGEETAEPGEARAIATAYREAFEAIERGRLDSNVSVKPTALGLKLGYDLFRENMLEVVRHAAERGNFVRIDMEESRHVDATLHIYRRLRESGHENVGAVLQSYLFRSEDDLAALLPLAPNLRIVKGAYLEPAEIAYPKKSDVDAAYVSLMEASLGGEGFTAIATHDETLIEHAMALAREGALPNERF